MDEDYTHGSVPLPREVSSGARLAPGGVHRNPYHIITVPQNQPQAGYHHSQTALASFSQASTAVTRQAQPSRNAAGWASSGTQIPTSTPTRTGHRYGEIKVRGGKTVIGNLGGGGGFHDYVGKMDVDGDHNTIFGDSQYFDFERRRP